MMACNEPTAAEADARVMLPKAWQPPRIEDADISSLTDGTGTSGIEGAAFLKLGS